MTELGKWHFLAEHFSRCIKGILRLFLNNPFFSFRLVWIRTVYFLTRRFENPVTTPDGFLIESPNELISYWSFFVERECWAKDWVIALRETAAPLFLDVGANAGLFMHWIRTQKPDAQFIAFEPLPKMAAKIRAWQIKTAAQLILHNVAVSNRCGTETFYATADNDTSASLKHHDAKSSPIPVQIVTLDSVVPRQSIFLIKIDVEGSEAEVLMGAQETLPWARFLIIEAHTEMALQRIHKPLGSDWNCQKVGSSDYLFTRRPTIQKEI